VQKGVKWDVEKAKRKLAKKFSGIANTVQNVRKKNAKSRQKVVFMLGCYASSLCRGISYDTLLQNHV
jgi:hypothetical protein